MLSLFRYGHVTYFWNGNKSGLFDEKLETYEEIESGHTFTLHAETPFTHQHTAVYTRKVTHQVIAHIQMLSRTQIAANSTRSPT
jgi:hypothetical protein